MSLSRLTRLIFAGAMFLAGATVAQAPAHTAAALASTGGCGRSWTPGSDISGTLAYGGLQRSYLLHVPRGYNPTTPVPLVLNLPGTGMDGQAEAGLTHMSYTADTSHFLVVYPNGTQSPLTWNVGFGNSAASGVDDVGFLGALVSTLEGELCIDTTRIDVTGMSAGALMAYHLACSNTPWLAAIAPVAGTMPQASATCATAHPTPLIAFNGVFDYLVPYAGAGLVPSIPQVVATWAAKAGCAGTAQNGFTRGDVTETAYTACSGGADTQLYTVTDGGHTWPGGWPLPQLGITSYAIDASSLMYTFFQAHPLH